MSGFGSRSGSYLAQQLSTLPREIVDNIFDDLTLFKILQLATWSDPVISSYILEHRHYGRLFLDAAHLDTAVSRFTVWCQVKVACGWRNDRHSFPLNPRSSLFGRMTYNEIMGNMMEDIRDGYQRGAKYAQLLSQFMPEPVLAGRQKTERRLRQYLQEFWKAQETIKELESHQLKLLADFLETYPDMLRWAYDPRGDASTTPTKHNIARLRACARKVFNTQYIRERKPVHCKHVFRNGILPITPRNSCLQLLLQSELPVDVVNWEEAEPFTVNETVPRTWRRKEKAKDAVPSALRRRARQGQALEVDLRDAVHSAAASRVEDFNTSQRTTTAETTDMQQYTSLAGPSKQNHEAPENPKGREGHPTEATATKNEFPSHVANDLRTVFKGLMHRYARPGHTIDGIPIARISASDRILNIRELYSMSSEQRKQIIEQDQPSFWVPERSKLSRRVKDMTTEGSQRRPRRKTVKPQEDLSVLPYHQQELEWLGAFLRSIAYLKTRDKVKGPA